MSVADAHTLRTAEISRRGRTFVPARHGPKVNTGTPSRPGPLHTRRVVCLLNALDHFEGFRFNRTAGL
jgi:hypothetical protein